MEKKQDITRIDQECIYAAILWKIRENERLPRQQIHQPQRGHPRQGNRTRGHEPHGGLATHLRLGRDLGLGRHRYHSHNPHEEGFYGLNNLKSILDVLC